jgi:hypothetical protein
MQVQSGATTPQQKKGVVEINHFLSHFEQETIEGDALFRRGKQLYILFKHLDTDNSGGISIEEFERGVGALNKQLAEGER